MKYEWFISNVSLDKEWRMFHWNGFDKSFAICLWILMKIVMFDDKRILMITNWTNINFMNDWIVLKSLINFLEMKQWTFKAMHMLLYYENTNKGFDFWKEQWPILIIVKGVYKGLTYVLIYKRTKACFGIKLKSLCWQIEIMPMMDFLYDLI